MLHRKAVDGCNAFCRGGQHMCFAAAHHLLEVSPWEHLGLRNKAHGKHVWPHAAQVKKWIHM